MSCIYNPIQKVRVGTAESSARLVSRSVLQGLSQPFLSFDSNVCPLTLLHEF